MSAARGAAFLTLFLPLLSPVLHADDVERSFERRLAAMETERSRLDAGFERLGQLRRLYADASDPTPHFAEREALRGFLVPDLYRLGKEIEKLKDEKSRIEGKVWLGLAAGIRGDRSAGAQGMVGLAGRQMEFEKMERWFEHASQEVALDQQSFDTAREAWQRRRLMKRLLLGLGAATLLAFLPAAWVYRRRRAELTGYAPGTLVGGFYRVQARVGGTALGPLYAAEDQGLQRPVWLQAFHPDLLTDEAVLRRVMDDMRRAATLRHPAILEIFTVVHGRHDAALILERGPASSLESLSKAPARLFAQAAAALAYAHSLGVAHGALEPSVFLVKDGSAKLRDFVYGRSARAALPWLRRRRLAASRWEAPELKSGAAPTPASDVFALSALLHEFLGEPRALIEKGLSSEPAARPPARTFAEALRGL